MKRVLFLSVMNGRDFMKEASCIPQGTEIERTGFHYTLSLIGGKYKMAVLYLLAEHDALRHNELHRRITGISFKTLASVLRALARAYACALASTSHAGEL